MAVVLVGWSFIIKFNFSLHAVGWHKFSLLLWYKILCIHQLVYRSFCFLSFNCTGSEASWKTETGGEYCRSRDQCIRLSTEESGQELQPGRPRVRPGHPGKARPTQGPEKGQGQSRGLGQKLTAWFWKFWKFLSRFMNNGNENRFRCIHVP